MNFIEEVTSSANPIWKECSELSFLTEMGRGTLDRQRFMTYIIQDSIYLRDYFKAYAMALYKSRTLEEMKAFYSVLGYVNDSENRTRLAYLADNQMTDADVEQIDKLPACETYTRFLLDCAENEELPEIVMALMPCMFGYYEVFRIVKEQYPQVVHTYFKDLVADYTSDEYKQNCNYWMDFVNQLCQGLDRNRKARLKELYLESSKQEFYFWKMLEGEKGDN